MKNGQGEERGLPPSDATMILPAYLLYWGCVNRKHCGLPCQRGNEHVPFTRRRRRPSHGLGKWSVVKLYWTSRYSPPIPVSASDTVEALPPYHGVWGGVWFLHAVAVPRAIQVATKQLSWHAGALAPKLVVAVDRTMAQDIPGTLVA